MNEQLAAKSENRVMSAGMKCKIAGNAHRERETHSVPAHDAQGKGGGGWN